MWQDGYCKYKHTLLFSKSCDIINHQFIERRRMENKKCLFVGFKGMKNSSCVLVSELLKESPLREDGALKNFFLLTNSFEGVKRDIEAIEGNYDFVIMFGCDKSLKDCVRLECFAEKDGVKCETSLDVRL